MANARKDVTNPNIDIDDFIGKSFTTAPDGNLYQLPNHVHKPLLVPLRLVQR